MKHGALPELDREQVYTLDCRKATPEEATVAVAALLEADPPKGMDPCGECPVGTCDHCAMCRFVEEFA